MQYSDEINRLDQAAAKALFLSQGLNPEAEHLTLSPEAVYGFQLVLREIRTDIKEARQALSKGISKGELPVSLDS